MTIKTDKFQVGDNSIASRNIVLSTDVTTGDLVISKGVHDGVLTEVNRISNNGMMAASKVSSGAGTVADALANIDGNLNFSTLPTATPAVDADLMIVRQGAANAKISVGTVRTEFAAEATAQAVLATAAKVAAESARDAALIQAGVYVDEPTGRAAVADGVAFKVQGSGDVAAYEYRRVSAGVASTLIATYPSSAAIKPLVKLTPAGYAWAVADQDNKVALGVADDGTTKMAKLDADDADVTVLRSGGMEFSTTDVIDVPFSVIDDDGMIAFGIDDTGKVLMASAQITTLNDVPVAQIIAGSSGTTATLTSAENFTADIAHFLVYGQSLSCGVSTDALVTTAQRFDNLKFSGGVRAQDAGTDPAVKYASLQPLIETAITPAEGEAPGTWQRETPCGGATDYIKELIYSENGISYTEQSYQLLGSAPGKGAQTIANLSKPGALYSRAVADVQYGYNLAQAAGKTYKCLCMAWMQGESDGATAIATYVAALNQLQVDFDADVKAITGQTEDVILITYQTKSSGNARLAQLLASETYPNIVMAGPHYHLAKTDGTHFTGVSSQIFGAYLGLVYKRVVIDGLDWNPVKLAAAYRQGVVINARFNVPTGPLVIDTTTVAAQANYGFTLTDSGGAPITISSATLVGPNTVRLIAASAVPAGALLSYAISTGAGNLRDSQGDTKIFGGGGTNYAMHNWCVAFTESIS